MFQWRIQDVGSPQFQLQVIGLDALIEETQQAGYRFLSIGAEPIHYESKADFILDIFKPYLKINKYIIGSYLSEDASIFSASSINI